MVRRLPRVVMVGVSAFVACAARAQEHAAHPVPEPVRRLGWNTMFVMLIVLIVGTSVVLIIMRRSTRRAMGLGDVKRGRSGRPRDPWIEAARRAQPEPIDPTRDIGEDRLAANDPDDDAGDAPRGGRDA